jgi:hypothetical protein
VTKTCPFCYNLHHALKDCPNIDDEQRQIELSRLRRLAERLSDIYDSGGRTNHTAQYIIRRLVNGDERAAQNEYGQDGDKLPTCSAWGRAFAGLLMDEMGCRVHETPKCQNDHCQRLRAIYSEDQS